jgi:phosphohistidine swiveling domain-containing protein
VLDRLVLPLAGVGAEDEAWVGGKAAKLAALARAGFAVPPGLCVTTGAFRRARALAPAGVAAGVGEGEVAPAVPEEVAGAVAAGLEELGLCDRAVAVRSSATAEDRGDASFAGQYESVLGARGVPVVLAALRACWGSFFSAHAVAARAAAGADGPDEAMAVLIQPVVEAECAGVAFSVDPVGPRRQSIVVDAAWGLGVGAVDGSVAVDSYRVDRATFDVDERRVVEKGAEVVLDGAGGTAVREIADGGRCRAACLPDAWVQRVAQVALAAEQLFGSPQDVEWAIAEGKLWVLQSRPITGLPAELAVARPFPVAWARPEEARGHWVREWFVGPRPRLPLDVEAAEAHGQSRREAALVKGEERYMAFGVFNGRRYFRMAPSELRAGDRRVRRAAYLDLVARVSDEGRSMWEYWAPEIIAATRRLASDPSGLDDAALTERLEDAFGAMLRHWVAHWCQGLLDEVHVNAGVLPRVVGRATGLSGAAAESLAVRLSDGEETVFTRLVAGLHELAVAARGLPRVEALVADPPADVVAVLAALPGAAPLRARLAEFLEEHGDRSGSGFGSGGSLTRPTWRDEPGLVLRLAAPYLEPASEAPAEARARALAARDGVLEELCAACAPEEAAELRRVVAWARRQRTSLEEHNHYIDQMSWGQLRRVALAVGARLAGRGALEAAEDVFWLRRDEIAAALGQGGPASWRETVAERRAEHAAFCALEAPLYLGVPPSALPPRPPLTDAVTAAEAAAGGSRLVGVGASAGVARGRARVVPMGTLLPDVSPGDVLVAVNAGPMWTPLFPILGGLVLDQGALLQHAATIAREFGVPAVLQTRSATRRIKDGEWVTVDGAAGTVEIG